MDGCDESIVLIKWNNFAKVMKKETGCSFVRNPLISVAQNPIVIEKNDAARSGKAGRISYSRPIQHWVVRIN